MSLTQFLDASITNMEHIQCIDSLDSRQDILCSLNGVLDRDSNISDDEPLPSKYVPIEDSNSTFSCTESSYTTSTTSETPTDFSELTDIALLMDGHLLNVDTDVSGIPVPPRDLPPGTKIRIQPLFEQEIFVDEGMFEPQLCIVDENLPLCLICYAPSPLDKMKTMPCCGDSFCEQCLVSHIAAVYEDGRAIIPCLSCNQILLEEIVYNNLGSVDKKKFTYMLVNAKNKPNVKACTNCYHIVERTEKDVKKMKKSRGKTSTLSQTICSNCAIAFCFYCQAPWHEGVSCKSFQRGDGLFKDWMKKRSGNQANAHRCPKCKVPIQRISGCPSMTCSRCHTHWCYDCGKRKMHTILFGGHDSKWSIFGCSRYKYSKGPQFTKVVRGSIFVTEIGVLTGLCLLLTPAVLALWPGILIFGVPTLIGAIVYYNLVK